MLTKIRKILPYFFVIKRVSEFGFKSQIKKVEITTAKKYVECIPQFRKIFIAAFLIFFVTTFLLASLIMLSAVALSMTLSLSVTYIYVLLGITLVLMITLMCVIFSEKFWMKIMQVDKVLDWVSRK